MTSLLTEPVASALLVVDETGGATLTEISRATGKPLSTIQRAVDTLVAASVLVREAPRGRLRFAAGAPRHALRELAEWRLRAGSTSTVNTRSGDARWTSRGHAAPLTIRDDRIRAAWPTAIQSIVSAHQPERIILFGSQARGDAGPDSDVDLLVVFTTVVDRRERRAQILRLLGSMPFAKDVLVATAANVARPLIGSVLADAVREGVTVYAHAPILAAFWWKLACAKTPTKCSAST